MYAPKIESVTPDNSALAASVRKRIVAQHPTAQEVRSARTTPALHVQATRTVGPDNFVSVVAAKRETVAPTKTVLKERSARAIPAHPAPTQRTVAAAPSPALEEFAFKETAPSRVTVALGFNVQTIDVVIETS